MVGNGDGVFAGLRNVQCQRDGLSFRKGQSLLRQLRPRHGILFRNSQPSVIGCIRLRPFRPLHFHSGGILHRRKQEKQRQRSRQHAAAGRM